MSEVQCYGLGHGARIGADAKCTAAIGSCGDRVSSWWQWRQLRKRERAWQRKWQRTWQQARPLFVLGPPRSGTTLVAKLLNAHPQVLVTNETRIMTFFEHCFDSLPTGDRGGLHCAREHGKEVVESLREHASAITRRAYEKIALAQDKLEVRYWGDKNPHLSSVLAMVDEWFPTAAFVAVRRDPRDIVCSILEMWARMGLVPARDEDADRWAVPDDKLADVCRTVRTSLEAEHGFLQGPAAGRAFYLDYEMLVRDSAKVLRPLFMEFLQLPDADHAIDAMAATCKQDVHKSLVGEVDFEARSLQRWRRDLDESQGAIANQILAPVLSAPRTGSSQERVHP